MKIGNDTAESTASTIVGIDTGGTFTDVCVLRGNSFEAFKIPSTPADPSLAILAALHRVESSQIVADEGASPAVRHTRELVHGTTVATNAILERKGARVAFVTTKGFEDLLLLGRQARTSLYRFEQPKPRPFHLTQFGVAERITETGEVSLALSRQAIEDLVERLIEADVDAVSICLLHAYVNPVHERMLIDALRGRWFLSVSHKVFPQFREFERAATTTVNAYIGPMMTAYVNQVETAVDSLSIMASDGGLKPSKAILEKPIVTVLSGPAAGVVGTAAIAKTLALDRVIAFDMGGTSTDVCLIDGEVTTVSRLALEGLPLKIPALKIETVGAGGGSIASVDDGGALTVGPESAGADPGPACYGNGGPATVTDAHVVLGRIDSSTFAGGQFSIDPDRSFAAIDELAVALGLDRVSVAEGILKIADVHMSNAVRLVSVREGFDPRDFSIVAYGGAGGLHGCRIAESVGAKSVVIPHNAGVLSALGMLLAPMTSERVVNVMSDLDSFEIPTLNADEKCIALMRYDGQSYPLEIAVDGAHDGTLRTDFETEHDRRFGYVGEGRIVVDGYRIRCAVNSTNALSSVNRSNASVVGPALIAEYGCTIFVEDRWVGSTNQGHWVLERVDG